jgi:hypothetical protein
VVGVGGWGKVGKIGFERIGPEFPAQLVDQFVGVGSGFGVALIPQRALEGIRLAFRAVDFD